MHQKQHCISTASSAAMEREFSVAGYIVSAKRCKMADRQLG